MVSHSKSYVVIVALAGHSRELAFAVGEAVAAGMQPVVVTDRPKMSQVEGALADEAIDVSGVRIVGVRRQPFDEVRRRVRAMIRRGPRAVARRLRRWSVGGLRRLAAPGAAVEKVDATAARLERKTASVSDWLSSSVVEPSIVKLGAGLSRYRQTRGVLGVVSEHLRLGRVVGIVCLDGPSLFPGWVAGRRYETLPVVTRFPGDWNSAVVAQLEQMEAGVKW